MHSFKDMFCSYVIAEVSSYGVSPADILDFQMIHDPKWRVAAEVNGEGVSYFVSSHINMGRLVQRLPALHSFLSCLQQAGKFEKLLCSLGDAPNFPEPCICFSSSGLYDFLIPDPYFCRTRAYEDTRSFIASRGLAYEDRRDVLFWRGALTGDPDRPLSRLNVIRQLNELRRADIDVKFTPDSSSRLGYIGNEMDRNGSTSTLDNLTVPASLIGERIPFESFADYKFHLDIDGNSNAWDSMFKKLLIGGVIFKLGYSYKQWYYDEMIRDSAAIWAGSAEYCIELFQKVRKDTKLCEDISRRAFEFSHRKTVGTEFEFIAERFSSANHGMFNFGSSMADVDIDHSPVQETLMRSFGDYKSLSDNLYRRGLRAFALNVFELGLESGLARPEDASVNASHLERLRLRVSQAKNEL